MTERADDTRRIEPTRRKLILGGAVLLGAGATLGLRGLRGDPTAPVALEDAGPFRAVFVTPRDDQRHVDASLFYPFGERHNPYAEGLLHYLEHLVWENVRAAGDDGGNHSNALTSPEATGYWLSRAPEDLPDMVRRLAASAAPLTVTQDYARKERDIVEREFDLRMLDDPMTEIWVESTRALYSDGAYGRSTIGTRDAIKGYTLEAAQKLQDQTHHLSEATLLLSGPITARDAERAISGIDQWPRPRAEALPQSLPLWPARKEVNQERDISGGIDSSRLIRRDSFLPPPGFDPVQQWSAREILIRLALSTKESSLARPLRFDQFIASHFDISLPSLGQSGYELWMSAAPDNGVTLDTLNKAVEGHLKTMLNTPDAESFREVQDSVLTDLDGIIDRLQENSKRLYDAQVGGEHFVSIAAQRSATSQMSYQSFQTFTQHFLTPRSSVIRMISAF